MSGDSEIHTIMERLERERALREVERTKRVLIACAVIAIDGACAFIRPSAAAPILAVVAIFAVVWLIGEYVNREDDHV